jgi:hypothetical protein
LWRTGYPALRNVGCEYDEDGTLTLRGYLPSYYLKQVALAAVDGVEGVARVRDETEIGCASSR